MSSRAAATKTSTTRLAGDWLRVAHLVVLVAGIVFLAAFANYDALWFDEAYSVGMAAHSFEEIWTIGATDVHPILYYWMLHVVYLMAGPNVAAYRLVSVAGIGVLALLGFTHVRRDFGPKAGLLFTLLVFLTPWSIHAALQIRMYAWLAAAVMVAATYGWRIICRLRENGSRGEDDWCIPLSWWAALALSSLMAAYLHYYGAIAAFCVQALVLYWVVQTPVGRRRNVLCWAAFAAAAVVGYLPWLLVAASQAAHVSGGFWISLAYPGAVAEIALFPFDAPETTAFFGREFAGTDISAAGGVPFLAVLGIAAACLFLLGKAFVLQEGLQLAESRFSAIGYFLGVYLGTMAVVAIASLLLGQAILYFRYLVAVIGPLLLVFALAFELIDSRWIKGCAAALLAVFALVTYVSTAQVAYSPQNDEGLEAYGRLCEQVQAENGGVAPLVVSDDWSTPSFIAMSGEGLPIVYMQDMPAYKALEPGMVIDPSWEALLDDYRGLAIFVGANETADAFARQFGGEVLGSESFYHPYSDSWLIYSVIDFEGAA